MKKVVRLTESDLVKIVNRVIIEQESSKDNIEREPQLEEQIFRYLDKQEFVQIEKFGTIHFANNYRDDDSLINYEMLYGLCYINLNLIYDISFSLSLKKSDFQQVIEQVIGKWVENTLQMKVTETHVVHIGNHNLVLKKRSW